MKPGTIPPDPFGQTNDVVKMNPPIESPDLIEPAGPTDPEVCVLSLKRPDGTAIAVLANYGLHYVGSGGSTDISADYFGVFCDLISRSMASPDSDPPFVALLSNGTSGDVNNINFREKRPASAPYEQNKAVARDVSDEVLRVIRRMDYQPWVALDSRQRELTFTLRLPPPEEVERARAIVAAAKPGQLKTGEEVYARETVLMSVMAPTTTVILQVLRIGELAIAAIPCEVFAETGLAIKANTSFKNAFTIELANGCSGYLPTPEQHKLGGYETWRARSSCLEVGAEPRIRAGILAMMRQISGR
jgi:neutral ceramidase